jgi:short-subunit dehydrogenase
MNNNDKTHPLCLLIGGSSEIGVAIAYEFATIGYDIVLAGRDLESINIISKDIAIRFGVKTYTHFVDILSIPSQQGLISALPEIPEVVIFSIGILGNQEQAQIDFEHAKQIIDINFTYPIFLLNYFANEFEKRKFGSLIGISSVAGDRGRKSNYIYGASKAAFTAYLSGLRNRLSKSNIHILTVKPGFVATKMTSHLNLPSKFTITAEQVAKDTIKAFKRKKDIIYSSSVYKIIMFVVKHIPERIFKKLSI